jgi:hypothetical protein
LFLDFGAGAKQPDFWEHLPKIAVKPRMRKPLSLFLMAGIVAVATLLANLKAIGQKAETTNNTNELLVLVKVSKTNIRVGETFNVSLQVENPAPTNQYVLVWDCSWSDNWKTDNTNIVLFGQQCAKNTLGRVEIKPGGAYVNEGEIPDGFRVFAGDGWNNWEKFRYRANPFKKCEPPPAIVLKKPTDAELLQAQVLNTDLPYQLQLEIRTNSSADFQPFSVLLNAQYLNHDRTGHARCDVRVSWKVPPPQP